MKRLYLSVVILMLIWAGNSPAQAESVAQAVEALRNLQLRSECCITRRGYLKIYAETKRVVEGFIRRADSRHSPELRNCIASALNHYKTVAMLMQKHHNQLICDDSLLARLTAAYPEAGGDFDQKGAMMKGPAGKKCISPALLVPIIYRRAVQDIEKARRLLPPPRRN